MPPHCIIGACCEDERTIYEKFHVVDSHDTLFRDFDNYETSLSVQQGTLNERQTLKK